MRLHTTETRPSHSPAASNGRALRAMLGAILVLLVLGVLYAARAVLIPMAFAVFLYLMLVSPVRALRRWGVPSSLGAGLVLAAFLAVAGLGAAQLFKPASDWFAKMPETLRRVEYRVRRLRAPVMEMNRTARRVERMANVNADADAAPEVKVKAPSLAGAVLSNGVSFLAGLGLTLVLLYFLLAYGDLLLDNLPEMFPGTDRRRTRALVHDVQENISGYLGTITLINIGLGATEGIAMGLAGMPNPVLWGVMAGLFNYVPFLCDVAGTGIVALVALFTFDSLGHALLTTGLFYAITAAEGSFLVPMILGRRFTLNPLFIFLSLAFWGWIWGPAGAFLAVPMLAMAKIICDRVPALAGAGRMLSLERTASR